jgi:hypothetical protein
VAAIHQTGLWKREVETSFAWLSKVLEVLMKIRSDIFYVRKYSMAMINTEYMDLLEGHSGPYISIFLDLLPNLSIRLADSRCYKSDFE